jgi:S1-C subfamily serine protease/antitoxin component YwqK of YwqJK toxin-antitoxin module
MKGFIIFCIAIFLNLDLLAQVDEDSLIVEIKKGCKYVNYIVEDSLLFEWNGECKEGWLDGFGQLTAKRNSKKVYTISCQFVDGEAIGHGDFISLVSNTKYSGPIKNGAVYGRGEYWNDKGDYYKGEIRNFILHGNGKMIYANGTIFEGLFNDFNFWTGEFTNLKDEKEFYQEGEKVEKLKKSLNYYPKIGELQTEYYDEKWDRCDKKDAFYFRKIIYSAPNTPKGRIRDYYIDGQLQNEFYASYINYDDEDLTFHRKSKSIYYYKGGGISSICYFNSKSRKNGIESSYYETGELFSESTYGQWGVLDGTVKEYYKNGRLMSYSDYSNGQRVDNALWQITEDGTWIGVFHFDLKKDYDLFSSEEDCSKFFVFGEIGVIDIPSKDCFYYHPAIFESAYEAPYSLELVFAFDKPQKENLLGLIFNFVNEANFCVLKFDAAGHFTLEKFENEVEQVLIPWTNCSFKESKDDVNYDVLVSFLENELIIEVNEKEVGRIFFNVNSEMKAGLFCKGDGMTIIRDFGQIVYYDEEVSKDWTEKVMSKNDLTASSEDEDEYLGNGSGFLISKEGYIATNYHVIEGAKIIDVVFDFDGAKFKLPATVEQVDKENDIAILKVDFSGKVKSLPYSMDFQLYDIGTPIFILGYPYANVMGNEVKFTNGTLNSRTGLRGDVRYYQVSAPVQPGNSGGPCFTEDGKLIGIVSASLNSDVYKNQNVNYVIKISYLQNLISLLPKQAFEVEENQISYSSNGSMVADFKRFVPLIYTK